MLFSPALPYAYKCRFSFSLQLVICVLNCWLVIRASHNLFCYSVSLIHITMVCQPLLSQQWWFHLHPICLFSAHGYLLKEIVSSKSILIWRLSWVPGYIVLIHRNRLAASIPTYCYRMRPIGSKVIIYYRLTVLLFWLGVTIAKGGLFVDEFSQQNVWLIPQIYRVNQSVTRKH